MADARLPQKYRKTAVVAAAVAVSACAVVAPLTTSAQTISGQEETVRQLETEIAGLDARFSQADAAYRSAQNRVDELTQNILANGAALRKAKKDFATAQVTLSQRISMIYRQPQPTQIEILLRSNSLSEVIATADGLERLQHQDARTIVRIRTARVVMAAKRTALIADRKEQVVQRAAAKKHLNEVSAVRNRRRAVLISARGKLNAMIAAAVAAENAARAEALRRAQTDVTSQIRNGGGTPATGGNSGGGSSGGGTSEDVAAKLRQIALCESGGDPTAVSPSGLYRGKYQFDPQTWASLGGAGSDPAAASEAEQDRVAALLYAQRGAAPWPVCGR